MSSRYYDGKQHIFYSDSSNDCYIKGLEGQQLYLQGTLQGNVEGYISTDLLGYNEISQGTPPDELVTSFTTDARLSGTDVELARNVNYMSVSSPFYVFGASKGGMSIWNESSGWNEYGTFLTYTAFTFEADTKYSSINEDGDIAVLTDGAFNISRADFYTRTGAVWSHNYQYLGDSRIVKLSGNYCLIAGNTSVFSIVLFDGVSTWTLQQDLISDGTPDTTTDFPLFLRDSSIAGIYFGGSLRLFSRSGTSWTEFTSFTLSSITGIDSYGDITVAVSSTNMYIYENYVLVGTLSITNGRYVSTNGTYIFMASSDDKIYCYKKINGVWAQSGGTTDCTGAFKISSNANYVSVGRPSIGTYGTVNVYEINTYTAVDVLANEIEMEAINLTLTSNYGNIIADGLIVSNTDISLNDGTVSAPSLSFADDTNTGLYRPSSDTIAIASGGTNPIQINGSQFKLVSGIAGTPSYSFLTDNNTGMYNPVGDTIGMACSGVEQFNLNTTELTLTNDLVVGGDILTVPQIRGVKVIGTTTQSIPNSTTTLVSSAYDTTEFSDPQSNITYSAGTVTVGEDGYYLVNSNITYASNATNFRDVVIYINGSATEALSRLLPVSGVGTGLGVSGVFLLSDTDTVDIRTFQNSGGALNIIRAGFSVVKIGK